MLVMMEYVCAWIAINFVQNNLFLWVKYVLEAEDHFNYLLTTVQVFIALFLIFWHRISSILGKKITYYIGISFWAGVEIGIFFVTPGLIPLYYVMAALAGMGIAVAFLIPWSKVPDVIEVDELETNQRREGIFYSVFVIFQKGGVAGSLALSSYFLGIAGYVSAEDLPAGGQQNDTVKLLLKLLVGPIPAVLCVLSCVFAFFYPITKEKHEEVQRLLLEKKLHKRDVNPITKESNVSNTLEVSNTQ